MHTLRNQTADEDPPSVFLGSHEIHGSSSPYVIAEAGVNHDGKLEQALRLVDAARAAGAQAVKFQVFRAARLVTATAPAAAYQTSGGSRPTQQALLRELELTPDVLLAIRDHCRATDIALLATPFSMADLQEVLALGVPAIKVASCELNNTPLLDAVCATTLPILLSTGASTLAEIDDAVAQLDHQEACERLIPLHCVSSYPTVPTRAALCNIGRLRERYGVWSGFSDHTEVADIAGLAVACGARVLEKHLTLDRSLPGPDHSFSLTPDQFGDYVRHARTAWQMLGEPRIDVADEEAEVRALSRKSVVAREPIREGQIITADLLTLKRPGGGIEPAELGRLIGRRALRDIDADALLDWSMFRE